MGTALHSLTVGWQLSGIDFVTTTSYANFFKRHIVCKTNPTINSIPQFKGDETLSVNTNKQFKRNILQDDQQERTAEALQLCLFDLVDLALLGKQAHWNVVGAHFRSVHL